MKPLNLATQPIRNETLPGVLLVLAGVVLLGVTVKHGFVVRSLLPGKTSALSQEVTALEAELPRLRSQAEAASSRKPDQATLKQWKLLKSLVDERAFSWTRLFARLEQVLPAGVRLTAIAPHSAGEGRMELRITALARTSSDGYAFLKGLQTRKEFQDVYPLRVLPPAAEGGEGGGALVFDYVMQYDAAADPGDALTPAAETPDAAAPEGEEPTEAPAETEAESPAS